MPLTRRQFELGIYDETESLIRLIYRLLSENKHLAYSEEELPLRCTKAAEKIE